MDLFRLSKILNHIYSHDKLWRMLNFSEIVILFCLIRGNNQFTLCWVQFVILATLIVSTHVCGLRHERLI